MLKRNYPDAAILMLRLFAGLSMAFAHGLPKLTRFGELLHDFPDPIGVGAEVSYLFTIAAEFFCALMVAAGLWTRYAAIPVVITMLVAAFVVHGGDPYGKKELALVYLVFYMVIMIYGRDKFNLDRFIRK